MRADKQGNTYLDPHERLTVLDPLGKSDGPSFHRALSDLSRYPKRGYDLITEKRVLGELQTHS